MKQFIFNIAWRQKLSSTKKSLLQHDRIYQVIVFFPKTTNKWQGKNDQEIFRDQISIQRFEEFLLRSEKQTNSLHELGNVTGVIISSSTCSDIMTLMFILCSCRSISQRQKRLKYVWHHQKNSEITAFCYLSLALSVKYRKTGSFNRVQEYY